MAPVTRSSVKKEGTQRVKSVAKAKGSTAVVKTETAMEDGDKDVKINMLNKEVRELKDKLQAVSDFAAVAYRSAHAYQRRYITALNEEEPENLIQEFVNLRVPTEYIQSKIDQLCFTIPTYE